MCALRFLYRYTLKMDWRIEEIRFPKKPKKLPVVLSLKEVEELLGNIEPFKYRVILATIYAAGLRVSEAANLKVSDIDSRRMVIRVQEGKGAKDRFVMLSGRLLSFIKRILEKGASGWSMAVSLTIQRRFSDPEECNSSSLQKHS
jgi:integrase/recombinase XerD